MLISSKIVEKMQNILDYVAICTFICAAEAPVMMRLTLLILLVFAVAGCEQTVTVTVSTSPEFTISGTPDSTVLADSAYSFTPTLNNTTGNTPTFSIVNAPSWATFSTVDGSLTGTPAVGDVAVYNTIQITATAAGGYTDTLASFSITVSAVPAVPVFTLSGTPTTTVEAGSAYSFTPTLNNTTGNTPTFSIVNAPSWATFSTVDGSLTGTPA
ncbi:MAG: putative Ig domain-containing protein, partial [Gammaproteobacteria bacterium]|nr:putative Ig domain-containing protein [Gammaproteobacteria bacterium]